jgi:hypothetical protein
MVLFPEIRIILGISSSRWTFQTVSYLSTTLKNKLTGVW